MEGCNNIQQMWPNLRAAEVAQYEKADETCRRKPMGSPGRGVCYRPQHLAANKSSTYPRHDTPPRPTRVEYTIHDSTTDNTHVSSTIEARYTSRSFNQAGDLLARTTLYHSYIDYDTDDARDAEKVTPTRPSNWQVQQPNSVPTSKQPDGHQDPSRRQREKFKG